MTKDEVAQDMAREWIAKHPGATVEEIAGWISACACMGCQQSKAPAFLCECGAKCACRCTLEPRKSQNAARWEMQVGDRLVITRGAKYLRVELAAAPPTGSPETP